MQQVAGVWTKEAEKYTRDGAVRQQDVAVRQVGVRVKGNSGNLVTALERRAIQRFDIRQHMFQLESF